MDHVRDVNLAAGRMIRPVKRHGEWFVEMRYVTETGKPLVLRMTRNDLEWHQAFAAQALKEMGESDD